MTNCPIFIIGILLLCLIFSNTSAQPVPPWYETESNKVNSNAKIDSIAFYENLISQANVNANYKPNITGMVVGGSLTGIGIILSCSAENSKHNSSKSSLDGLAEGVVTRLGGIFLTSIGLPVFIYNFIKYLEHKDHANYRDEVQQKLWDYKSKNSAKLIITPTVNFMGGVGFHAILGI